MHTPIINRYPITIDRETVQVGTANELAITLDVLQGQYDREVLSQLFPHLAEIIGHASGFITVIRSLSVENQLYLIQAIGPDLANVIQKAAHLRDILAIVAEPQVEEAIITTLGSSGLRQLVMTGEELAEVLEWVYGAQDERTLELLGIGYIRRLCRHASQLSAILHTINFSLQAKLIDQLGWTFVIDLVKDGRDLAYLLRALPPASSAQLLHHFSREQLVGLVGNAEEWAYLYQRLEPAEAELLSGLLNIQ